MLLVADIRLAEHAVFHLELLLRIIPCRRQMSRFAPASHPRLTLPSLQNPPLTAPSKGPPDGCTLPDTGQLPHGPRAAKRVLAFSQGYRAARH